MDRPAGRKNVADVGRWTLVEVRLYDHEYPVTHEKRQKKHVQLKR